VVGGVVGRADDRKIVTVSPWWTSDPAVGLVLETEFGFGQLRFGPLGSCPPSAAFSCLLWMSFSAWANGLHVSSGTAIAEGPVEST
jgi:hypothetical protein